MSRGRNSFFLIVLLTLLQCFAPLLHAHAFGVEQGAGVHLHDAAGLQADDFGAFDVQTLAVHSDESPAIGIAQEYRQDTALVLSEGGQTLPAQFPTVYSRNQNLPLVLPGVSLRGGRCGYFIPFSQAPPLALI